MTDLVRLGYRIDTGDLDKADKKLDKLGKTARQTTTSLASIGNRNATAVFDQTTQKAGATEQALASMGGAGTTASNSLVAGFSAVRSALAGLGIGVAVREVISLADSYKSLQAQLSIVTSSQAELSATSSRLNTVAQDTRSTLESTYKLYTASLPSLKELGFAQNEVARYTELASKSMKIAGGTTIEHSAATLQLVQAMGSGVLRGEEFNSIMENGRGLAMALADGLNVPIGALRGMAEQGQLTADVVVNALLRQGQVIDQQFALLPVTSGQAWQQVKNDAVVAIGEIDAALDFSGAAATAIGSLSSVLQVVANNVGVVSAAFVALAGVIAGRAVVAVQQYVTQKLAAIAASKAAAIAAAQEAAAVTAAEVARARAVLASAVAEKQRATAMMASQAALNQVTAAKSALAAAEGAHAAATTAATAATTRMTVAQTAAAAASRVLAGALALVGGPIGLIVAAGAAIYAYRQEIYEAVTATGQVEKVTRESAKAIDQAKEIAYKYANANEDVRKSLMDQAKASLEAAQATIKNTQVRLEAAKAALVEAEAMDKLAEDVGDPMHVSLSDTRMRELRKIREEYSLQEKTVAELEKAIANLGLSTEELDRVYGRTNDTIKTGTGVQGDAVKALRDLNDAHEEVIEKLELEYLGLTEGAQAMREAEIRTEVYKSVKGELTPEIMRAAEANIAERLSLEHKIEAQKAANKITEDARDRIQDVIDRLRDQLPLYADQADALELIRQAEEALKNPTEQTASALEDQADAMTDSAEAAAELAERQEELARATEDMLNTFGSALRNAIASGADTQQILDEMGNTLIGWLEGMIAHFEENKITVWLDEQGIGENAQKSIMTGLSTALQQIQAGEDNGTGLLSGIGAGIGFSIGGAIGGAIGAGLGEALGGLFDDEDWSKKYNLDYAYGGGVNGSTEMNMPVLDNAKFDVILDGVGEKVNGYLTNMADTIVASFAQLGAVGADSLLQGFTASIEGAKTEEQISAWLEQTTLEAYRYAFDRLTPELQAAVSNGLDPMTASVEEWGERMEVVAQTVSTVVPAFDVLGVTLGMSANQAILFGQQFVDAMGGLEPAAAFLQVALDNAAGPMESLTNQIAMLDRQMGMTYQSMGLHAETARMSSEAIYQLILAEMSKDQINQQTVATLGQLYQQAVAYEQALEQLNQAMADAQIIFNQMGVGIDTTTESGRLATQQFIDLAGGMDQFQSSMNLLYDSLYTEEERQQQALAQASAELQAWNDTLGLTGEAMIDTTAEARAYLDTLDMSTESGQRAALALADMIVNIQMLEDAGMSVEEALASLPEDMRNVWLEANGYVIDEMGNIVKVVQETFALAAGEAAGFGIELINTAQAMMLTGDAARAMELIEIARQLEILTEAGLTTEQAIMQLPPALRDTALQMLGYVTDGMGNVVGAVEDGMGQVGEAATQGMAETAEEAIAVNSRYAEGIKEGSVIIDESAVAVGTSFAAMGEAFTVGTDAIVVSTDAMTTTLQAANENMLVATLGMDQNLSLMSENLTNLAMLFGQSTITVEQFGITFNDLIISLNNSLLLAMETFNAMTEGVTAGNELITQSYIALIETITSIVEQVTVSNTALVESFDTLHAGMTLAASEIYLAATDMQETLNSLNLMFLGASEAMYAETLLMQQSFDLLAIAIMESRLGIELDAQLLGETLATLAEVIGTSVVAIVASTGEITIALESANTGFTTTAEGITASADTMNLSLTSMGEMTTLQAGTIAANVEAMSSSLTLLNDGMTVSAGVVGQNTAAMNDAYAGHAAMMASTTAAIVSATGAANTALAGFAAAIGSVASAASAAAGVAAAGAANAGASARSAAASASTAFSAASAASSSAKSAASFASSAGSSASGAASAARSAASSSASVAGSASSIASALSNLALVNGSHAMGLAEVPFDGYIAELHKGEMVVPANDAAYLRGEKTNADPALFRGSREDAQAKELKAIREELTKLRSDTRTAANANVGALKGIANETRTQTETLRNVDRSNDRISRKLSQ